MRVHTGEDVWSVMQSRKNEGNDGVETDFREKNRHRCIGPCDRCSAAWLRKRRHCRHRQWGTSI